MNKFKFNKLKERAEAGDADAMYDLACEYERMAEMYSDFSDVVACVIDSGITSVPSLQRRFGFGYPKASRFIEQMEKDEIISKLDSSGKRNILVTRDFFEKHIKKRY